MEPIAVSTVHALIRSAAVAGDQTGVLRDGSMVSGEVLQRLDGGSVLIAIGNQRVQADPAVDLQPGDRFRAVVEKRDGGFALRILTEDGEAAAGSILLEAVRSLLGEQRSVGAVLRDLAAHLRAALDSATSTRTAGAPNSAEGSETARKPYSRP